MSDLFGGSKQSNQSTQSSSSSNLAYPTLLSALGGEIGNNGAASTQMANMLGLNGDAAQGNGFQNWQNSTGYKFGLDQGINSITGNAAASGLLNSGGALKAIDTYGQNYANTQYGNYMNQLSTLAGLGNTGAGILGSTGGVSQSQGQSSGSGSSMNDPFGSSQSGVGQIGSLLFK